MRTTIVTWGPQSALQQFIEILIEKGWGTLANDVEDGTLAESYTVITEAGFTDVEHINGENVSFTTAESRRDRCMTRRQTSLNKMTDQNAPQAFIDLERDRLSH